MDSHLSPEDDKAKIFGLNMANALGIEPIKRC